MTKKIALVLTIIFLVECIIAQFAIEAGQIKMAFSIINYSSMVLLLATIIYILRGKPK